MDVDLALLADAATIDGAGKLNILGIFDRLHTPKFPARHPKMALVLRFSAPLTETGSHEIEITLKDPVGSELMAWCSRIRVLTHLMSGSMDHITSRCP